MEAYRNSSPSNAMFPVISPEDIIIPILGMTGAGKSSFISLCTQQPAITIGHSLSSCTSGVTVYSMHHKGRKIHLVDTPGFDDTGRNDCETLQELAFWLVAAYEQGFALSGIVYLHRITDLRVQGAALQSLQVLKKLCGPENYQNLVMATTRWDEILPNQKNKALFRHRELCQNERFWGDIQKAGGQVISLSNDRNSALKLLEIIAAKNRRFNLAFQRQFVDEDRQIYQTDAGRVVYEAVQGQLDQDAEAMEEEARRAFREQLDGLSSRKNEDLDVLRLQIEEIMQPRQRELDKLRVNARQLEKTWTEQLERDFQMLQATLPVRQENDASSVRSSSIDPDDTETDMHSPRTAYSEYSERSYRHSATYTATPAHVEERLPRRGKVYVAQTQKGPGGVRTLTAVGTVLGAAQLAAAMACTVM